MVRVVVTGMGAITPLGIGFKESWQNLLKNKTGISKVGELKGYDFKCTIGSPMPSEVYSEEFHKEHKMRMDDKFYTVSNYIMKEAIEDAKLDLGKNLHVPRDRVGIAIANLGEALQNMLRINQLRGGRLLTVTTFGLMGAISMEYNLQGYQGMNANGCAASMFSIGDSYRQIKDGYQDIIFAGGIDKNVGNFSHIILDAVGALNTKSNHDPEMACRPFDQERNGAVQADGGAMLVLESEESAHRRGARILAEIVGYHTCSVADNLYKPSKLGIQKVMSGVIKQAGWNTQEIDLINGHATATLIGDPVEAEAIKSILTTPTEEVIREIYYSDEKQDKSKLRNTAITAFKGHLGHLNLASGATELGFCIKAMNEGIAPGIINLKNPVDSEMNFVYGGHNQKMNIDKAIKVAVGFGANNAAIGLKKYVP